MADALVAPDFKHSGLLDTAVVTIRYDNGAHRHRGVQLLGGLRLRRQGRGLRLGRHGDGGDPGAGHHGALDLPGSGTPDPARRHRALRGRVCGELAAFCAAVRSGAAPVATGEDARAALRIALACIESVETGGTVAVRDTDREAAA